MTEFSPELRRRLDCYLRVVKWARTRDNCRLTRKRGRMLSDYARIEQAAWNKYMEDRPNE